MINSWVPIGPPGNNNVTAIAVSDAPPTAGIYVGTDGGGVLRTSDGGKKWSAANTGLTNLSVRGLVAFTAFTPGLCPAPVCGSPFPVLYVGTYGGGVFRGDGTSWTAINNGLGSLSVTALAVAQTGSVVLGAQFTLYVGTLGGGIFRSDDGGANWAPASASQAVLQKVTVLAANPTSPVTAYAAGPVGLFKTVDGGGTWSQILPSVSVGTIGIDPVANSMIYISGESVCPFSPCGLPPQPIVSKSLDSGETWQDFYPGLFPLSFAFQPTGSATIAYAGGFGGVTKSTDRGATWELVSSGLPSYPGVQSLTIDSRGTVYAGVGPRVFASGCVSGLNALCLGGGRFLVGVSWGGVGSLQFPIPTPGTALPLTINTGAFWFFDPTNLELVVKVLDGRSINGKLWVFYGSLTNVEFTLTVTDTLTGSVKTYFNPQGQLASVADTAAF